MEERLCGEEPTLRAALTVATRPGPSLVRSRQPPRRTGWEQAGETAATTSTDRREELLGELKQQLRETAGVVAGEVVFNH